MSDLIDRQAVIDLIEDCGLFESGYDIINLQTQVMELPSAEPQERKTGWWILTSDENYEYCTCSECGYENGENWMIGSKIKYCANCGSYNGG